ncbi:aminopeptidase [Candidatus Dependentiae bacterium]|nr:aminopeptidase [Candidatus Dependentiae bacterium]
MKKLFYQPEPFFLTNKKYSEKAINNFSKEYMDFIEKSKTERLSVIEIEKIVKSCGYQEIELYSTIKKLPQKFYIKFFNKNIVVVNLKKNINNGINFIVSHIDTPHIDLKQNPLTEMSDVLMFKTHYYGGIKKYQWLNIPLCLTGIVITRSGKTVNINIGNNENDPVLVIPDIAPHLSKRVQDPKIIKDAVTAEMLNAVAGTVFDKRNSKEKNKIKMFTLNILNKKYGIIEEDLLTAELQLTPSLKPRFSGLDESIIAGYGHDDRACSFASLKAILDIDMNKVSKTNISIFYDKEETGSDGPTGAQSLLAEDIINFILETTESNLKVSNYRKIFLKSNAISADVNSVINPNFPDVFEPLNCSKIGYGAILTKFTGHGGKSSTNDANTEFISQLARLFERDKVCWQIGSFSKVDEGGGGTIAKHISKYGCNVVDCGIGVMSMHSPYELISKYDLFSVYLAYKSFFTY